MKVPLTRNGIHACKSLSSEGIRVNVTLVFSAAQALLAAKAGATFVSPFVGRLDDIGTNGMDLIRDGTTRIGGVIILVGSSGLRRKHRRLGFSDLTRIIWTITK